MARAAARSACERSREARPASVAAVRRGDALDVARLPSYGFGTRSLMWWGTAGMCAIEGVAFAFMIVIYFYLRSFAKTWPDDGSVPELRWGTVNLVLILLSALPNWYTGRAALDRDVARVRAGLIACAIVGAGLVLVLFRSLQSSAQGAAAARAEQISAQLRTDTPASSIRHCW